MCAFLRIVDLLFGLLTYCYFDVLQEYDADNYYCGKVHSLDELDEANSAWFKKGTPRHGCVCIDCPDGKNQPLGGPGCKAYICKNNSACRWAICLACQNKRSAKSGRSDGAKSGRKRAKRQMADA